MFKALSFGDLHFPWHHEQALLWAFDMITELGPFDLIIQVGDIFDLFAHSKFPKTLELTPEAEFKLAIKYGKIFWNNVKILNKNPRCDYVQLKGNHDVRPQKRLLEAGIDIDFLIDLKAPWNFEGIHTVHDYRKEFEYENWAFHHGHKNKLGDHLKNNRKNTNVGHTHRGGVHVEKFRDEILFELNSGYLGNPEAKALGYTAQKWSNWTLGLGYIDKYGPRFIHYPNDYAGGKRTIRL
jgi:hypothetical protein